MSDDYTPTTDDVQHAWVQDVVRRQLNHRVSDLVVQAEQEFDRWLAAHDAEVAARTLEEQAEAVRSQAANPTLQSSEESGWMREHAAWLDAAAAEYREGKR